MTEFPVLLISLTLSASLIALALFALKPLYRNRLSKAWQYYIWLIVVVRLLLPLTPEVNLMRYLFEDIRPGVSLSELTERQDVVGEATADVSDNVAETPAISPSERGDGIQVPGTFESFSLKGFLEQHLITIWLVVALVLFVRKLTGYLAFVRYIKAGCREAARPETLDACFAACEAAGIRKPVPVYENKLASSPMLVGMLRPFIVLPELPLDSEDLELILRHELVHYRRRDIFYKWLVQLALCVHWFNPVVYLVSREVNRSCELSCDEAVLRRLPESDRRRYGDTLLATLQTGGGYGNAVAGITLTEDGKNLKERLQSILKHHSGSVWTKAAAVTLSVTLLCGASFAGAYTGGKKAAEALLPVAPVSANPRPVVMERSAAPFILKKDEYIDLMTVYRGETRSVSFQASGDYTALLMGLSVGQEGKGAFTLTVRDQAGNTVVDITASIFKIGANPTVFGTDKNAIYTVEIKIPESGPDSVSVHGANVDKADAEQHAASFGEGLAQEIVGRTLDFTFGSIEKWAEQFPERWGQWNGYNNNGESWRTLNYLYEDGYLVGVGVRNYNQANWLQETVTLNGKSYTLSYPPAAAEYKDNAKVKELIKKLLTKHVNNDKPGEYSKYTVRSVVYNDDPQALLRQLYRDEAFIEFMEVAPHCKGLPVIEELLPTALDDDEEMFFLFLAEQLPDDFNAKTAEAMARKAAKNENIVILSALERFLPKKLYKTLIDEAIGMDDMDFDFDFDFDFD